MATNEKPFSATNWGGQDALGITTGGHQSMAGHGDHGSYSAQRWAARRTVSPVQPLPEPTGPLISSPAANAFVAELVADMDARKSRAVRAAVGGVVAGLAVRAYHRGGRLSR